MRVRPRSHDERFLIWLIKGSFRGGFSFAGTGATREAIWRSRNSRSVVLGMQCNVVDDLSFISSLRGFLSCFRPQPQR